MRQSPNCDTSRLHAPDSRIHRPPYLRTERRRASAVPSVLHKPAIQAGDLPMSSIRPQIHLALTHQSLRVSAEVPSDRTSLGESWCGDLRRRRATIRGSSTESEQTHRSASATSDPHCPEVERQPPMVEMTKTRETVRGSFVPQSVLPVHVAGQAHLA